MASPELIAAMGLGPPVQGPAQPGPHLWADPDLRSLYYSVNKEAPLRPELPAGAWERLDATIDGVIARLGAEAELRVAFVLAEDEAERRSELTYVFFEPLAEIVVALSHRERDISISADDHLWRAREYELWRLINHAEHLLRDGRLADALRLAAEGLQDIFVPATPP